jgi:hypothetical protein
LNIDPVKYRKRGEMHTNVHKFITWEDLYLS